MIEFPTPAPDADEHDTPDALDLVKTEPAADDIERRELAVDVSSRRLFFALDLYEKILSQAKGPSNETLKRALAAAGKMRDVEAATFAALHEELEKM